MAYITQLDVSLNKTDEQNLQAQSYKKINVDLIKGAGGNCIYLWYKQGDAPAITRLQVTFTDDMGVGLINAGYTKIPKNLNAGARGSCIYLWYFSGSTKYDTNIVDIDVTENAKDEGQKFDFGWERLACDLNRYAGGNMIYAWVKREKQTYICDVTATPTFGGDAELFTDGYIRVDEDVNKDAGGAYVFIWYRQTTDPKCAITDLQISTNDSQRQQCQQQNYTSVDVNLNEGTKGVLVFLWWLKQKGVKPIKVTTVLLNQRAVLPYEEAGVNVIQRNLNTGNNGAVQYLCVYKA